MHLFDFMWKRIVTNKNNKILIWMPKQKDRSISADSGPIRDKEMGYINNLF